MVRTQDTQQPSPEPDCLPTRRSRLALRCGSVYLAAVAAAVAANFIAYPLYAYDSSGESSNTATEIWLTIDWFMATGLLMMLMITFKGKKASDAKARAGCMGTETGEGDSSTGTRRWIESNLLFYSSVLLTLAFIPNWFAAQWGHNSDGTIWHLIDTVLPVLFAVQARRIWRMTAS